MPRRKYPIYQHYVTVHLERCNVFCMEDIMKKTDIISTAILQKVQNNFSGKVGMCEIYSIDNLWVTTELLKNNTASEIKNVTDFEKALQSTPARNLIVSAYLVNRPALEKMLMRTPIEHRIFYTTYMED